MSETSSCSSCSAPVRWVTTEGGRQMPIDPEAHPDGNVVPVQVGGEVRARVLGGSAIRPPAGTALYRSHLQTCPDSELHRKARARRSPRCRACGQPLDVALLRVEPQHDTHPACFDPAEVAHHVQQEAMPA